MRSVSFLPPDRTCYICKKSFCARENDYAYKRAYENGYRFFCSYSCMRKFDRERGEKKPLNRSEKKEEIIRLRNEGKSRREVASILGITENMVKYYDVRYGGLEGV